MYFIYPFINFYILSTWSLFPTDVAIQFGWSADQLSELSSPLASYERTGQSDGLGRDDEIAISQSYKNKYKYVNNI